MKGRLRSRLASLQRRSLALLDWHGGLRVLSRAGDSKHTSVPHGKRDERENGYHAYISSAAQGRALCAT